jgi:ribose 5-phosphate isomerase RpiB
MPITFPGYVPDVTALTDRVKAEWGNAIRDRTPQIFDTMAHLVAAIVSPQTGQLGIITTGTGAGIYEYDGAAWTEVSRVGAWLTYTPAITNITSPASRYGHYKIEGKKLYVVAGIVCGAGTVIAANPTLDIPSGLAWSLAAAVNGKCRATDDSSGVIYLASCFAQSTTNLRPKTGADGSTNFGATTPFTWATNDTLYMSAWGELA